MATIAPALMIAADDRALTPPENVTLADAWAALVYERIAHGKLRQAYRDLMSGRATMPGLDPTGVEAAVLRLRVTGLANALANLVEACETAVRPPAHVAATLEAARVALGRETRREISKP